MTDGNLERRALGAVIAAAFVLRLAGIHFGLPDIFHQDEPIIVNHALAYGTGDWNPHFFKVPPLLSYLLFFVYGVYYFFSKLFFGITTRQFALLFFQDPSFFYLLARSIFGALFGTASVYILYGLAKKIFNRRIAFIASLTFALNYLHVRDSHYVYVDIPMVFAMLLCCQFLSDYSAAGNKGGRSLVIASIWAGIAVAFKYIAAPIVLLVILAVKQKEKTGPLKFLSKAFFVLSLAVFTYAVLNPYSFFDLGFFLNEIRQQAAAESAMPFFHHLRYSLFEGCGSVMVLMGLAGLGVAWFKSPTARWFLSFPVIYYLIISFFSQTAERYALPIVPFLCVSSAYFAVWITDQFNHRMSRRLVLFGLIFLMVYPSLKKSMSLDLILTKKDTRTAASEWIRDHVPPGEAIVMDHPFFSPRLRRDKDQLLQAAARITPTDFYAKAKSEKISLMLEAQKDQKTYPIYYLNDRGLSGTPFLLWGPLVEPRLEDFKETRAGYYVRYRYPQESGFFEQTLKGRSELLAVFSPYRKENAVFTQDRFANTALPFLSSELFSRKTTGPYLEIYRVRYEKNV